MKKTIAAILLVLLVLSSVFTANAEIDLSGLSFDELLELQRQITFAIMQSDGWQKVEVPAGYYEFGKDIPSGRWTLQAADGNAFLCVYRTYADALADEYSAYYSALYDEDTYTVDVTDGMGLRLDDPVYFMPYTATFSFK